MSEVHVSQAPVDTAVQQKESELSRKCFDLQEERSELIEKIDKIESSVAPLIEALREIVKNWDNNSGRIYEGMGRENPRVEAIDNSITKARAALQQHGGNKE